MIRHCVFIQFRSHVGRSERDQIFGDIARLQHHLPGILSVSAGANVSPEVGMDRGFSDGFVIDFIDAAARDEYLADAAHQRVGARIVEAAQDGVAGVFVFDLEIA